MMSYAPFTAAQTVLMAPDQTEVQGCSTAVIGRDVLTALPELTLSTIAITDW